MELDRKVREFPIPAEVSVTVEDLIPSAGEPEPVPLATSMERYVLSNCREVGESASTPCLRYSG